MPGCTASVIHGDSGKGKSRLADTLPGPRLILDAEGGTEWTPSPKVSWDPRQPLPTEMPDGSPITTDTTVVVIVREFSTMQLVLQWMQSGQHYFESVALDSLTEIQKRCKDALRGMSEEMTQQIWGTLLDKMERLVRDVRDLKMHPTKPVNVVITAGSVTKEIEGDTKKRPDVQGALIRQLAYYMDVVGYLYVEANGDTGSLERKLLIQPIGIFEAKDRTDILTQRYGHVIVNPNMAEIVGILKGEL